MKDRVYFSGLNELRAFAALVVVLHHTEIYKKRIHLPSLYQTRFVYLVEHLGKNGVFLFFVLSGFLITYLLLSEIKLNGRISLRSFYVRRILRIWPLYYIIMILGFFIIPLFGMADFFSKEQYCQAYISSLQSGMNLVLFIIFFSNLAMILFRPVVGASQTWSVSVEEQFYGIWPLMMNKFRKKPWIAFTGVIILKPLALHGIAWVNGHFFHHHQHLLTFVAKFLSTFSIELMAIGALGAWLLFNYKEKVERIFSDRRVFVVVLVLLAFQLFRFSSMFPMGITFLCLILCFICRKISFPVFNFLGSISYGIYMYHPMVMFISYAIANNFVSGNQVWYNVVVYTLVFSCTIGISYLSFEYIEKRFLRLKEKFSVVPSGKTTA
ncbi:MAG: acyltransferase [Bacteroidota bacterium]